MAIIQNHARKWGVNDLDNIINMHNLIVEDKRWCELVFLYDLHDLQCVYRGMTYREFVRGIDEIEYTNTFYNPNSIKSQVV